MSLHVLLFMRPISRCVYLNLLNGDVRAGSLALVTCVRSPFRRCLGPRLRCQGQGGLELRFLSGDPPTQTLLPHPQPPAPGLSGLAWDGGLSSPVSITDRAAL